MPLPGFPKTGPLAPAAWFPETGETELSDAVLVARAKVDPQSFALLYRRYVTAIYRYCYHRLGNVELAEDATSDVFLKALAALPKHRDDQSFRSWLFAIAHNVVIDGYRARRQEPLDPTSDFTDPASSPEDLSLAAEGDRAVRALLAQLTPDQARVMELRLAGMTGAEVARTLGRSLGSVKIAQFRACSRLRQLMGTGHISEVRDGN